MAAVSKLYRTLVILAVAGAIAAVLVLKNRDTATDTAQTTDVKAGLPQLIDLGAGKCAACKMMTPILADLKRDFSGVFDVTFIDVWENGEAAEKYAIRMIPTQIFFDADGKELFRHEGFFSREDILKVWSEHGVVVDR